MEQYPEIQNNSQLISLLHQMQEENVRQRRLLERQCRLTRLLGILLFCFTAAVLSALLTLLPRFTDTLNEMNVVVANTQEITEQLKSADLNGTIQSLADTLDSIGDLVDDSSESLSITLKKMEAMDIDTLNKAINDLYRVVNPLASLFSR
ncbi:MAG: hypothetical protein HFI38_04995 [Lachnospiraceae bacterium]|jgi:hypothetical protein|nr:hypothetical protein [Lachnospiraceae bacterium]